MLWCRGYVPARSNNLARDVCSSFRLVRCLLEALLGALRAAKISWENHFRPLVTRVASHGVVLCVAMPEGHGPGGVLPLRTRLRGPRENQ